ncbi:MAG: hypothetical protein AAF738_00625 [Bacteroidota bacterium]
MEAIPQLLVLPSTSLQDAAHIQQIAQAVQASKDKPTLVLVDTMGDTQEHLQAVSAAFVAQDGTAFERFHALRVQYDKLLHSLFQPQDEIHATVNDAFVEIEWALEDEPYDEAAYYHDQITSVGAIVASKIVAAHFQNAGITTHWLDARDTIKTDNQYQSANIVWDESRAFATSIDLKEQLKHHMIITQGAIGSSSENFTTTFGEGGIYQGAIFFAQQVAAAQIKILQIGDVPALPSHMQKRLASAAIKCQTQVLS